MNDTYEGPLYPRVVGDTEARDIHWSPTVRTLGVEVRKGVGRGDAPTYYPGLVQSPRGDWWLGLKPGMTRHVKPSAEGIQPATDNPPHLDPTDFGEIEDAYRTPEEKIEARFAALEDRSAALEDRLAAVELDLEQLGR